jgi:hypothetical protein
MFDPLFYIVNDPYSSNLDVVGWTTFTSDHDYVLRMILDNWWESGPPGQYLSLIAKGISSLPGACNDLSRYQVKSVLLQHVPEGEEVLFAQNDSFQAFGRLIAGKGTWVVDMVFRPNTISTERTYPSLSKWRAWLAYSLSTDKGAPIVQVGGLWELEGSRNYSDASASTAYNVAYGWWNAISPFWEVFRGAALSKPAGFYEAAPSTINTDKAWNRLPNYMGQDGVGIQMGSALAPLSAIPLAVAGTQVALPLDTTPGPYLIDPATGQPVGAEPGVKSWQDVGGGEKAVALVVGAFVGYALFKKFGDLFKV